MRSQRTATLRLLATIFVALTLTAELLPLLPKATATNTSAIAQRPEEPLKPVNIPWTDVLEVIDADHTDEELAKETARYVGLGYSEQELIIALTGECREILKQGSDGDYIYEFRTLCNYKDLVIAERLYWASITQLKIERDTRGGIAVKIPVINMTVNDLETYGVTFRTNKPGHLTLKRTTDNMTMQLFIGLEGCIALIALGTYTPSFIPLSGTAQTTTYKTSGDISLVNGCLVVNGKGQVEIKCESIEVAIYILNETALIDVTDLGEEHSEAFNIVYGKGQLVRINGRIYLRVQLADDPNNQASDKQGAIAEIVEALELKQGIEITVKIQEDIHAFEEAANATNAILKTLRTTTRKIRIAIAEQGSPEQLKNTEPKLKRIYNTLNNQHGNTELQTLNQIAEQAEEELRQIIRRIERDSQTQLPDNTAENFYQECLTTLDETRKQIENTKTETQELLTIHILNVKVAGPGTTKPRPGTHRYIHGETIDILALPESTSTLKGFKLDGKETKARIVDRDGQVAQILTIKMDRDHTVEAEFQNPDDTMAEAIRKATIDRYTIRLKEIEEQSQTTPTPSRPTPPKPVGGEGGLHENPNPNKTFFIVIWIRPLTTKRTDIYLQPGTPPTVASYYATANIKNYDATYHQYRLSIWIDHGNQYRYAAFNTGQKLGDGFLLTETIHQFYSNTISLAIQKEYETPHDTRIEVQENVLIHGLINPGDTLSAAAAKVFGQETGAPVTGIILYAYSEGQWRLIDNEYYGYLTPKLHPAVTEVYTQFLDTGWWGVALAEAGQTIAGIPGNLAQGIQEGTVKWSGKAEDLRRGAVAMGVPLAAADFLINDLAEAWLGFNGALVDLFAFGALSALDRYAETGSSLEAFRATAPGQFGRLVELTLDPHVNKEERAKFFGKIIAYVAVILAAKAASVVLARVAPKLYAWVFAKPSRALLLQKTKTLLSKITGYGKIAAPGLYAAELVEKLFAKVSGATQGAEDTAIAQVLDDFADLYDTYVNVYGEQYARVKAGELLGYIDDQLRLREALVNAVEVRVRERFGDGAADTLKKLAEPYGATSLRELASVFKMLKTLEEAADESRQIKILSQTTIINDFVQAVRTRVVDVPDEAALMVVSRVTDVVDDLAEQGVSLVEIRQVLTRIWSQISSQQIDANTILNALEEVHRDYVEDLYATDGGSRTYTIREDGTIAIWKGALKKVWNINTDQRQVLELRIRHNSILRTIYAGYDRTEELYVGVVGGNPREKVEVLDVRALPIEEFVEQIHLTMLRPEGDLRLVYDRSTLEKVTIEGDRAELMLKEEIGAEQETRIIQAQVSDYFAWAGEAYIQLKVGIIAENVKTIRIYRDEEGQNRLILGTEKGTMSSPIIYLEADETFLRALYGYPGDTSVTGIYVSDTTTNLDRLYRGATGIYVYTVNRVGQIWVREDSLRKLWNIDTKQRQVLKLKISSIDHSIQETIYAGYDGETKEHRCITVVGQLGKPGQKIELLDVRPFPIEEFVSQIHFAMKRPEGDLPLRYESSTLERVTVGGGKVQLVLKGRSRVKEEVHTVEAEVLDYFAWSGEVFLDLRIGSMPQNMEMLRLYQDVTGENRLVLKSGYWAVLYLEVDDLFSRVAYDVGGSIRVSETYISHVPISLKKIIGLYQLSAVVEPCEKGSYMGYRTYGKILADEKLEIIRKEGSRYNMQKSAIGRDIAMKVLIEKLGFPEDKMIVKQPNEHGSDIPATDRQGNNVTIQVKLDVSPDYLAKSFGNAIEELNRDVAKGNYKYGLVFLICARRQTGELIIEWFRFPAES